MQNGLYYQDAEHWTADRARATDFKHTARALIFAAEERVRNVELVLDFEDPRYNIVLPILDKTPHWPSTPGER